jgi:hypothetical protein
MLRLITAILLLPIMTNAFGQGSSKLMSYHLGFNLDYTGPKGPDFALPVGIGLGVGATLNKSDIIRPTIELSAVGFPEFVLNFSNNDNDNSKYAYGVYNLLVGTKVHVYKLARISLTTGPSFNSRENALLLGVKPSVELSAKKDKLLIHLYYLNIVNSEITNGYIGMAVLFKFR